ncbi:NADP-dependent oxidoreductase domain-containing protein [Mycena rosella]|uniref:NADP-dependent oxidoreductase domain-containing protein n=1 Tax=Mycena rosella TaxID=1033263 RepID=A0AAD7GE03_MYCRO|nr:NADP-dependent oxidoreductase domain-containing protein [Mycena rosella]
MSAKPISNITVLGAMNIGAPDNLGVVRFTTPEATTEVLDVFQKYGHSEVDTARTYGKGTSEEYLGAVGWQKRGIKMETKLAPTKGRNMSTIFGEGLSHSPADLRKGLTDSLKALKTDRVYMYYLHGPDRSVPFEDTLREVNKIFEEGVFERFGISNYLSWEVAQICEICKQNGWILPSVYQGQYSTIQRGVEAELIPCLRAYGISFYAFNPLAGSFLTARYTRDQTVFDGSARFDPACMAGKVLRGRYWNDATFKALELLRPVIALHGITESEAALRWLEHHSVLKKEVGDGIVVGAGSTHHLENNLKALDKGPLPADVVEALDAGWAHTRGQPSRYWH